MAPAMADLPNDFSQILPGMPPGLAPGDPPEQQFQNPPIALISMLAQPGTPAVLVHLAVLHPARAAASSGRF